jgi:hypothetical protein
MTGFGFGGAWKAAEDFLRRTMRSRAVREAEKRRDERRSAEAWRKSRRAATLGGTSAAGTFAYAATIAPLASAAIAAGAAAVAGLAIYGMWSSRAQEPAKLSKEELAALPCKAEEWLLERRLALPATAGAPLDAILDALGDLPPRLGKLEPNSTLAWEARRMIADHLPTLVESWCALPAATRERDFETRERLIDGLGTIAKELGRLCEEASHEERMAFETRRRFLDARYGEGLPHR